ncbi:MAG: hypothetical protein AAGF06_00970 [Pseudomonadota bacterium]
MELNKTELLFKRFDELACANFCTVLTLVDQIDALRLEGAFHSCIANQLYPELTLNKRPLSQPPHVFFQSLSESQSIDDVLKEEVLDVSHPLTVFYQGNRLAVVFQHHISDGRSSMVFLNQVLLHYYGLTEPNDCVSAHDTPVSSKYHSRFKLFHLSVWVVMYFFRYFLSGISRFPDVYDRRAKRKNLFVHSMNLTVDDNQFLADQCMNEGVSYTAKLAAKYMLAIKKYLYHGRNETLAILVAVDMKRRRMNVLRCDTSFLLIKHRFSALLNESIEATFHRKIQQGLANEYPIALFQVFPPKAVLSKTMVKLYMMFQQPAYMLTNYGNLNAYISETVEEKIDALYSFVPPSLNTVFTLTTYTFKGVMCSSTAGYGSRVSPKIIEKAHSELVNTLRSQSS